MLDSIIVRILNAAHAKKKEQGSDDTICHMGWDKLQTFISLFYYEFSYITYNQIFSSMVHLSGLGQVSNFPSDMYTYNSLEKNSLPYHFSTSVRDQLVCDSRPNHLEILTLIIAKQK